MDKLLHSRFFRFLVCFVLVCAILINCSPLRAEATAIGATVITGTAAAGILGLLFSMAMGVVFADITAEMVSGIGQSVIDSVTNKYANDTETSNTVKEYFDDLSYTFGGSGDDGTGNGDGKIHILDGVILAGLVAWVSSLIKNDGVEIEKEVSPDSSLWVDRLSISANGEEYNFSDGLFFPVPIAYRYIYTNSSGIIRYYWFNQIISKSSRVDLDGRYKYGDQYATQLYGYTFASHGSTDPGDRWDSYCPEGYIDLGTFHVTSVEEVAPLVAEAFYASTTSITIPVVPDIYVGDIPSQVKDDTFDEEKYRLPYIDYSRILPGLNDYVTELNNIAQQLADNTKTYEEYMKDIQPEQTPDPDPSPDPSDPSDPEETKPEEDEGDEEEEKDLDMFSLDLSDYFPFCIPFDLYDFFTCLNAEPVAPVIEWFVPLPGGGKYPLRIDLSAYDDVAQLLRRLQLLLFCVGLAFKTRDLIKG